MAKIKKDVKQEEALKQIEQNIAKVQSINVILGNEHGNYTIHFSPEDTGKAVKISLDKNARRGKKLDSVLLDYKHELVREIDKEARKQNIELDDKDIQCMVDL